jgi:hypothetical protein
MLKRLSLRSLWTFRDSLDLPLFRVTLRLFAAPSISKAEMIVHFFQQLMNRIPALFNGQIHNPPGLGVD